jgi:hypothetical protein
MTVPAPSLRIAGFALCCAAWGAWPTVPRGEASSKTFVDAPADALAVLDRARAQSGGAKRLNSVSSIRIEGVRTRRAGQSQPFVHRFLFPDRFKIDGLVTHSIDGPVFWQRPEAASEAVRTTALRNVKRRFTEESLVYLLRAPGIMPLRARIQSQAASTVTLVFEGPDDFRRSIVFDSGTGLPVELFHDGTLTQGGVASSVERRLRIERRSEHNGISVPTQFRETIGAEVAQISVAQVVVDGTMTGRDFRAAP